MRHSKFNDVGKIIYTNEMVKSKRNITKIVIHCLQTPVQREDSAEDVDRWHLKRWGPKSGIGYHYVIQSNGSLQIGRSVGKNGAHTLQHNKDSLAVAIAGGMDWEGNIVENAFTKDTLMVLSDMVEKLMCMYPDVPIYGHRELDRMRKCPCLDVPKFIKGLKC